MSRIASPPARSSVFQMALSTRIHRSGKSARPAILAFGYQGGLNAWRKFEPDRFSDEEVEQFKKDWRATHPAIKKFWYNIDRATWQAVREREKIIRCGRLLIKCSGMFLYIKLPSWSQARLPLSADRD